MNILNDFETVPVFRLITDITSLIAFHNAVFYIVRCILKHFHFISWSRSCLLIVQWLLTMSLTSYYYVAGSIPACVIGIFHWHNPSDRTMVLGSTQPLTEMSTRNISWW